MRGGVSKAVLGACDPSLEIEAEQRRPALGSTALLQATGTLASRGVRTIAYAAILKRPVDQASRRTVVAALENFASLANRHGIRSAAIPLIGSRIGRLDPRDVARAIVEVLTRPESGLKTLVLTAVSDGEVAAYIQALDTVTGKSAQQCAFIVVDMIEEFVGPGRLIPTEDAACLSTRINAVGAAVRAAGRPVVFVRDVHEPSDPELVYTKSHSVSGPIRLLASLDVQSDDLLIDKHTYSAFYETALRDELVHRGCETVVFAGTQTHVCVKYSALFAMFMGFRPIVLRDLCLSTTSERHQLGLDEISRYFGEVTDAKSFTAALHAPLEALGSPSAAMGAES
jgi:nicotinamidase-related amidase/O-acetyl-ADP-ribose deacetylase (regulator of RNase III)